MVAIGYVRRSKESGARTVSLDVQRDAVTRYAREQGWAIAEVIADDGISGGRRERLDRIEAAVKRHKAGVVVVYNVDRFARDVAGMLDALRAMTRRGVELHVVGRGRVEVDTASGFLVAGVEGLMAEHYRRVISEKTRDALARLRTKGQRVSRWAPYGFKFGPGGTLLRDASEQATAVEIAALAARGLSLRGISAALAERGVLARNGRPFAASTLAPLVRNRAVTDSQQGSE